MLAQQSSRALATLLRGATAASRSVVCRTVHPSVPQPALFPRLCSPLCLGSSPTRSLASKVPVSAVKELRERTGSPMMDCKNALEASGGDIDGAIDWLRKKGMATAAKKESRKSADGLVAVLLNESAKRGSIIELNAETDFVAKNDVFKKLATDICALNLAQPAQKPLEAFKDEKLASGPKSTGEVSVDDAVKELVATFGENCQLRSAASVEVKDGVVISYLHTPMGDNVCKLGVLVGIESEADAKGLAAFGSKLAMHIAAGSPKYLEAADIPEEAAEAEKTIFREQAASSGKPAEIVEKMIGGRLKKWREEVVLLEQDFLIQGQDDKKRKVSDVIKQAEKDLGASVKVSGFARVKLGDRS